MAISRSHARKSPSQSGVAFTECKQQGGAHGKPSGVPEKPASGAQVEKIYGKKALKR